MKAVSLEEGYNDLINAVYETASRNYVNKRAKGIHADNEKRFIESGAYGKDPELGKCIINNLDKGLELTQMYAQGFDSSDDKEIELPKAQHHKIVVFAVGKAYNFRTLWDIQSPTFIWAKGKKWKKAKGEKFKDYENKDIEADNDNDDIQLDAGRKHS